VRQDDFLVVIEKSQCGVIIYIEQHFYYFVTVAHVEAYQQIV
jgi:hypothetical protein